MARHKKQTELAHRHETKVRFTDAEYEVICEDARRCNLQLAVYLRNLITNKKVTVTYKLVQDNTTLREMTAALWKIGTNLNQISRYFNQHGASTPEIEKDISDCIREIYKWGAVFSKLERGTDGDTETHFK